MEKQVDIIIPVYRPDQTFEKLIRRLQKQTVKPNKILIVNTEKEYWDHADIDKRCLEQVNEGEIEIHHITREEFDHGGTRRWAAKQCDSEFFMCMTQDAVPADRYLIENLLKMMETDSKIGAVYARQLPASDCHFLERYTRRFNYGEASKVHTAADFDTIGIKACFCSNVCAMYRKSIYCLAGGFTERTIFNEDMICAGTMLQKGYKTAYAANAKVIHSHNYSAMQQFKRNFDLGVSQKEHPEIFSGIRSEGEGIRLVKSTAKYVIRSGKIWMLPKLIWQSGWKYLGYQMGKHYDKLTERIILKCTSNKAYWKK